MPVRLKLRHATPEAWIAVARDSLDAFLQDHAANERKVSQSALRLAVQHPQQTHLVEAMIELAREEMDHFYQVYRLLRARGSTLAQDVPDPYMSAMRRRIRRQGVHEYLLDRLLLFGIIEARGYERFSMLARGLPDGELADFYKELARSEARHASVYVRLAREREQAAVVDRRLDELLDAEAHIARQLPLRPALH